MRSFSWLKSVVLAGALAAPWACSIAQTKWDLASANPPTVRELEVDAAGIRTVIWATGFAFDFSWIDAPGGFDAQGYPRQHRGVSGTPGLYYLGQNWLSKRKSGIIFGVEEDAEHLGELIAQRVHSRDRRRA